MLNIQKICCCPPCPNLALYDQNHVNQLNTYGDWSHVLNSDNNCPVHVLKQKFT